MFFTDSSGFFSLVCLMIQCGIAWVFAAFFGVLAPGRQAWLRSFMVAFVGLGIALTSMSTRFGMVHSQVAGHASLAEGDLEVRAFYGVYFAGKILFFAGLLRGIGLWRVGRPFIPIWLLAVLVPIGFVMGFVLPTVGAVLMVQGPLVVITCLYCSRLLRPLEQLDRRNQGRSTVRVVLLLTAVAWTLFVIATTMSVDVAPADYGVLQVVLRFNAVIDLGLQVVLAAGLIIAVMTEAYNRIVLAQEERDRLRSQVERDDKLRVSATLISGVAHEINNPLTAIIGYGEDLASEDVAVRTHAARVVQEQAARCRAIVKRMSSIGRRHLLTTVSFGASDLVQRVVDGMRPQLNAAGVSVAFDVPAELMVVADVAGFEQVLTNLVDNAIQVSARGQSVEVSVHASLDGARLCVRDHGPGVPAADRSHVFEPFWTTKRPSHGTGLGLAVVDAIVHAHSGKLEVADADGGGAIFLVTWPWRSPSSADESLPISRPSNSSIEPAPRDPLANCVGRLLIIDDEKLVRATIRRHAEISGWYVDEVASAEEGLSRLVAATTLYDTIVCDLRMPGMSGVEFYDELVKRESPMLDHTLFVTGDLASQDAAEFAKRCRSSVLAKPFAPRELMERLNQMRH
ncbi:MAG: signal transduction histidine kinase [Candidatus Azotimanducaceae bacterium]|jgi:signal transduction histidine kinase